MSETLGAILPLFDSVISKIALLLFLFVVLKFITKRLAKTGNKYFKTFDKKFMKFHLPLGFLMVFLPVVHGICSVYSIEKLGYLPYLVGLICFAACIAAIGSYYMRKKMEKPRMWLTVHQFSTLIAFVTLIGHIMLAKQAGIAIV